MKKAFTMVELIMVIVVIGILASIAVPRLVATRDDAEIAKATATVASVRAALSTERQLRVLRGDFAPVDSLNADGNGAFSTFGNGAGGDTGRTVLEGSVAACANAADTGCWAAAAPTYTYRMPTGVGGTVAFSLQDAGGNYDGRFTCDTDDENCQKLTQ